MDLPGRFPTTSASGNKYIFVMIDYDSDYIKFTPMTSQTKEETVCCFRLCYNKFKEAGFTARLLKLNNEVSKELITSIKEEKLNYQFVAPYDHWLNQAERAIQSIKNHIIFILAGADPDFPKDQWDLLLPHVELTLNISRPSWLNPHISENTQINGEFNFDKTPLAPAGCKVILHDDTEQRPS